MSSTRTAPIRWVWVGVVVHALIAATPPRAKAPVVVTVSTRIWLDALVALRRLGFSQRDTQCQLDTALGLAIQQSLGAVAAVQVLLGPAKIWS